MENDTAEWKKTYSQAVARHRAAADPRRSFCVLLKLLIDKGLFSEAEWLAALDVEAAIAERSDQESSEMMRQLREQIAKAPRA